MVVMKSGALAFLSDLSVPGETTPKRFRPSSLPVGREVLSPILLTGAKKRTFHPELKGCTTYYSVEWRRRGARSRRTAGG